MGLGDQQLVGLLHKVAMAICSAINDRAGQRCLPGARGHGARDQQLVGLRHKGGVVLARVDEEVAEHLVGQLLVEHGVGVDQREEGLQHKKLLKHCPSCTGRTWGRSRSA